MYISIENDKNQSMKKGTKKDPQEFIPTRQSLLSRLKDMDDSKSWEDFFNTYWRLIYSVAIKSGLMETEAQEVVQETVIAISKKMPGFKYDPAIGSFKAWLLNQTRWRIQDQFRRRKREFRTIHADEAPGAELSDIEHLPDPAGQELEAIWNAEWQENLMKTAMERVKAKISPKQYQVFDLYVTKNWPVEKVEKALGVSSSQVYLAKHRISALLKEEILSMETNLL